MKEQKIISFKVASDVNVKEVVEKVEDLLKLAKNGEINGLAIVALGCDESVSTAYCGSTHEQIFTTIGAIDILKQRLIKDLDDE